MPLPGTRVIHRLWSNHHRRTSELVETSMCEIHRAAGKSTSGPGGSWVPPAQVLVYQGSCRIIREDDPQHPVVGDNRLVVYRYVVQISVTAAEIYTGDSITVTESEDPTLVGRKLRVDSVIFGSEVWSRDLIAVEFGTGR